MPRKCLRTAPFWNNILFKIFKIFYNRQSELRCRNDQMKFFCIFSILVLTNSEKCVKIENVKVNFVWNENNFHKMTILALKFVIFVKLTKEIFISEFFSAFSVSSVFLLFSLFLRAECLSGIFLFLPDECLSGIFLFLPGWMHIRECGRGADALWPRLSILFNSILIII